MASRIYEMSQSLRTPSRELTQLSTIMEAVYTTCTTRTESSWISLQTNPVRPAVISYPSCSVNVHDKFILVNCRNTIYRYDIINNVWQKWREKKNFGDSDNIGYRDDIDISAMNKEPIIYHLCNAHHEDHQGNMFAMIKDLNSNGCRLNSCKIIPTELEWCRTAALYLEEYDKKLVHSIGLFGHTKHRFFCTKNMTQPDMWRTGYVDLDMGIVHHGVVYIQSQHRMLFFGGRIKNYGLLNADYAVTVVPFDTIREYDLGKQAKYSYARTWSIVNEVKLPYKMFGFGYILTVDEQHIVIFGGKIPQFKSYSYSDKIFVIDLATMNIAESQVKCPDSGMFRAISVWENNGKLVRGFIQRHMTECELLIPSDVCNVINLYYKDEYVHLICYEYEYQLHWKMNIEQIISNTFFTGAD